MTHEEQQQQTALFNWAQIMEHQIPELALMYHIPNEGQRSKVSGAILKSMGLKKGIPDVCLPVSHGRYGALYIEMKAEHGVVSREQKAMMAALEEGGNKCVVCRSWTEAKEEIEKYLNYTTDCMLLFRERKKLGEMFDKWAEENGVLKCAQSVVSYLHTNGLIKTMAANDFVRKGKDKDEK